MAPITPSGIALLALFIGFLSATNTKDAPRVKLLNGTYEGLYSSHYKQDHFLGIPYAQSPIGERRFNNPISLNETFGVKKAVAYAPSCVGYGNADSWTYISSEDCLTLNIVRPAGCDKNKKLPVAVWIHGGGYSMDYSANGVYNLSFIVQESVQARKPIIAVSLDYRLSAWGFLAGQEVLDAGVANLGLKDQHIALRFIKENIAEFGGDSDKITIWGESAGGGSVGYMAQAYGGRDDGLFRAIIAQSPAEPSNVKNLTLPSQRYDNLTSLVGCNSTADRLACLRKAPFDALDKAIQTVSPTGFQPIIDGEFVQDFSSSLLPSCRFAKRPLLIGTNSDEGTLFVPSGINTDRDFANAIGLTGANSVTTTILMALYPDILSLGIPSRLRERPNNQTGFQYKRAASFFGDYIFLAPRRLRSQARSSCGVKSYVYQFDAPRPVALGTPHFGEVAFTMCNTNGLGYPPARNPFLNATESTLKLAKLICRMWISFIHDLDPNTHGLHGAEKWPVYNATSGYGEEFFFNREGSRAQPDTYRLEGTAFINTVEQSQFGR
ncbi:putative neuroligin [Bisporella sp. PMI_857]|nr:putative neuroligin [Bisporella sp. PMI_857]